MSLHAGKDHSRFVLEADAAFLSGHGEGYFAMGLMDCSRSPNVYSECFEFVHLPRLECMLSETYGANVVLYHPIGHFQVSGKRYSQPSTAHMLDTARAGRPATSSGCDAIAHHLH